MRRLNRVVNKEDSVYPPLLSKSPLIEGGCNHQGTGQKREQIVRGVPSSLFSCSKRNDEARALRIVAEETVPKIPPVDHTRRFDTALLRRILGFVGDSPSDMSVIGSINSLWRRASFSVTDEITAFPNLIKFGVDTDTQSKKLTSLSTFINVNTRGQHVRRLTVVDSRAVFSLPQSYKGPSLTTSDINRLTSQTPNLTSLDVRGLAIQDFVPLSDKFFVSLHLSTPCLRTLKIGAHFIRNWSPQWWARLPYLSEFTVGSRREDADWDDSSPIQLCEDFFAMLRSPAHVWSIVKIWVPLSQQSLMSLLVPFAPFPKLVGLAVNASGNCHIKPLEEGVPDAPRDEKKKTDKVAKKGTQQDDLSGLKGSFPSLISFTVSDVNERPDFSVELMGKICQQAPHLKNFNVTNTQRMAPTHIEPPTVKGRRARRVA